MTRRAWRLALVLSVLPLVACAERGTAPPARIDTPVRVSASLTGSAVAWLSVEVTASDIAVPLVVTLDPSGGTAHGTITVPSGPARTFTARGYDVEGTLTHRAAATVDVAPGTAATVPLVLLPVTAGGTAGGGDDRVTLSETDVVLVAGLTRPLTATVAHADGTPVSSPAITWATLDARIAAVSPTGLVTAIAPGTTQVVALSGGGAGVVNVVVQ
jgi:Bacterial Ig-like domain (group 2)